VLAERLSGGGDTAAKAETSEAPAKGTTTKRAAKKPQAKEQET